MANKPPRKVPMPARYRQPKTLNPYSPDAIADRRHLLLANHQQVSDIARRSGYQYIAIADTRDPLGAKFKAFDPDGHAQRIAGDREIPTIIIAVLPELLAAIQADYQTLELTAVPGGLVQVFVFAAGGMMSAKINILPAVAAEDA